MSISFTVLKHSHKILHWESLIQSVNIYFVSTLCLGTEDIRVIKRIIIPLITELTI